MARPVKLILPNFRPRVCAECPLCGRRPASELAREPGTKWTHRCVWDQRVMSGRGIKQPNARNRCSVKKYEKMYFTCQGDYMVPASWIDKFGLQQTKLLFPPV